MTKYLTILLIILCYKSFSQDCIIQFKNQNRLLLMYNYFDVYVKNVPKKSLFLSTNNGNIVTVNNKFRITPERLGKAIISVFKIVKKDTIFVAKKQCIVESFKEYTFANIGGRKSGLISKAELAIHYGLSAAVENLDIELEVLITSFRLIILRNDSLIYTKQALSYKFDDEIKKGFALTQSGDILYFVDIKAKNPDPNNTELTLNNIIIKVK